MRPADGREMHNAALPLWGRHSTPVLIDHRPQISEKRGMDDGEVTVRSCATELLEKGVGRATWTSYLRRQVGDTRTLVRSVGSATTADLFLTYSPTVTGHTLA